jgi:hypothetical protein
LQSKSKSGKIIQPLFLITSPGINFFLFSETFTCKDVQNITNDSPDERRDITAARQYNTKTCISGVHKDFVPVLKFQRISSHLAEEYTKGFGSRCLDTAEVATPWRSPCPAWHPEKSY